MALSFLSQNSGLLDLQSIFDPQYSELQQEHSNHHQHNNNNNNNNNPHHQPHEELQLQLPQRIATTTNTKFDLNIFSEFDQMEFNNNNNNNNNLNRSQYQNNNNNSNINSNSSASENINQIENRHFISGYHHQHIGTDYEQVINFVDSPPNSEESWTEISLIEELTVIVDGQSKDSPGPQIIDVQTIYLNSGTRKRRMDWDSLDIGQTENSPTASQSGELPTKVAPQEKDKHKREKHSGRSSWSDEIGFDLNAEFNSSSYLNNSENFLSFSPTLTALKQEPQTEQIKPNPKLSLDSSGNSNAAGNVSASVAIAKVDEAQNSPQLGQETAAANGKHDLSAGLLCGCGSPQGSPVAASDYELGGQPDKGKSNPQQQQQQQQQQQLSVLDPSKIELGSANGATHAEDHKFQYILAAATSIATKNNEETLTYLNQGQSYEIKLKKIGDLSLYRDKILKSVIKICFHERRLQFMEREQMQQWQQSRPGERIIEVDVPLSYGLCHVSQPLSSNSLNTVEIFWDPLKEVGVYIKVNCISTEFTPKKHGGEKGVPFRLQIETYIESNNSNTNGTSNNNISGNSNGNGIGNGNSGSTAPGSPERTPNGGSNSNCSVGGLSISSVKHAVHAAACQIKVFKLKGADRKHKQDREKIQKRPQSEQDKFQPSYECTIMNDMSLDLVMPATTAGCYSPEYMKLWPNSPSHIPKYDGMLPFASSAASPATSGSSPIAINSVTSTNSPNFKLMDATNMVSPQHVPAEMDDFQNQNIMPESTPSQVTQWLTNHRLTAYLSTFAHFSGADIMRMSKEDLIQICGLADGIRMFNILRAKTITPRLTLYASMDGCSYNAIYLLSNTAKELQQKLFKTPGFYEFMTKASAQENGGAAAVAAMYNNWSMHSKYSGSGSNIFNEANKSCVYISGPSGILVSVTDEVLNNEIKDGSLYALDVQGGKVILKLINKQDNN
ncbi:hybrid signal transduction histidine kinase A isoform X5 [Drosophila guanche]|uniref:hybrid signal transduction histidine kinase A isoform X5 n=1 Tax=Drosophila guanche TaxID=7266 RepID=UPI00147149C3|nr:hybrid signal transduction histidine kinase A isoform X5 [Drosophila guanche]